MREYDIEKIDDRAKEVEVCNQILSAAEEFGRLSSNAPKALLEVTQHVHGRFDDALYNVYKAANTYDSDRKIECLHAASEDLFYQYTSLKYIVRLRGATVGAANEVIKKLKPAYEGTNKWLKSTAKHGIDRKR